MKKLYEKNELWFSLAWIIGYVVVMGNLRGNLGDGSLLTAIGVLAVAAGLLAFVGKNNLWEKYGLVPVKDGKKYLYFVPLVLLATVNLWFGITMHFDALHQIYAFVTMAAVGFVEEMIFRGLLFRAIEKENTKRAILISALTFGAGHIINLLTGHGSMETLMQVVYASVIGLAFVMLFYRSGCLIPCILSHSLVDITSTFSRQDLPAGTQALWDNLGFVFLVVVAGGYAWYLYRMGRKER